MKISKKSKLRCIESTSKRLSCRGKNKRNFLKKSKEKMRKCFQSRDSTKILKRRSWRIGN